jgi:hypothetical protein
MVGNRTQSVLIGKLKKPNFLKSLIRMAMERLALKRRKLLLKSGKSDLLAGSLIAPKVVVLAPKVVAPKVVQNAPNALKVGNRVPAKRNER